MTLILDRGKESWRFQRFGSKGFGTHIEVRERGNG
jgi:hypothetical protein